MKNKLFELSKFIINKIYEKTILSYFIIFYCSFMVCCPPFFITYVPGYIKTPLRLIGMFTILLIYVFFVIYKQRISKLFVFTFVMCLYFFIVCIINGNDYYYALYSNFLMTISAVALFEIYSNSNIKKIF